MRVYYDNMIVCGLVVKDIRPEEMAALLEIEKAHAAGAIKRVTSRESWREQQKTQEEVRRAQFESARDLVSVVQADHRLIGFNSVMGPLGTMSVSPIISDIVDEDLFKDLKALGLKEADARHFMYAVSAECDWFVTLDPHFLDRRASLKARCPSISVVTASELLAEL